MPNFIDRTGQRFGRLIVKERAPNRDNDTQWFVECDCGNETTVKTKNLVSGYTKSCGCFSKEVRKKNNRKHGMWKTPEFRAWCHMRERCLNPSNKYYKNYGGRGITVCKRWQESFINFFNDMGKKPSPKHSLDRIDNNGDYTPENCRWATAKKQLRNTRQNRIIEWGGQRKCVAEWAEIIGLPRYLIYNRIFVYKWSVERAFTTPPLHP